MGYSDLKAKDRYMNGSLAHNEAELVVERYFESISRPLVRNGLQGAPTERAIATTWPSIIRHQPDYLGFGRFIEVKSCSDQFLTFKKEDMQAFDFWNKVLPVWIAIYVYKRDRLVICELTAIKWATFQPGTETIILDKGTRGEKEAWRIPMRYLEEDQRVANAFEAAKVHPIEENYVGFPPNFNRY